MDKGSAELFGQRMCSSMLSNRNLNRATIQSKQESIDNRGAKIRGSMLTPRQLQGINS